MSHRCCPVVHFAVYFVVCSVSSSLHRDGMGRGNIFIMDFTEIMIISQLSCLQG